jgi:hypothetical protein
MCNAPLANQTSKAEARREAKQAQLSCRSPTTSCKRIYYDLLEIIRTYWIVAHGSVQYDTVHTTVGQCSIHRVLKGTQQMMTKAQKPQIQELSKEQARRMFNREAQRYLKMKGKDFIEKWDAGMFNGKSDSPEVMRVAMLLPFGR